MIGGSFIGAEFSSGSIANWLSFIPRRGPVYASKLITVVGFSAVLSAVCRCADHRRGGRCWPGCYDVPVVEARRRLSPPRAGVSWSPIALAVVGFCIGLLARHTAAAIGVLLGYLFVWFVRNGILGGSGWAARLTPWTPEGNISRDPDQEAPLLRPDRASRPPRA